MAGKTYWRGRYLCSCAIQSIEKVVEPRMRAAGIIKNSIDIFQAGYNGTAVAASAGTHAGGGVLDVAQFSTAALRIWRECGWWMWHRTPAQGFMHHGHGVLNGCPHPSAGAKSQVTMGKQGYNGLASWARDDGPKVPVPTYKEAYAKYAGGGPTPAPPSKEEGLLMGAIKKFGNGKKRTINLKKWYTQDLNGKGAYSIATGPADALVTVQVQAVIPEGATLQIRMTEVLYKKGTKTKIVKRYPVQAEQVHTSGKTFVTATFLDTIVGGSGGRSRRLRYQVCATGAPVTIERSWVRVTTQKR